MKLDFAVPNLRLGGWVGAPALRRLAGHASLQTAVAVLAVWGLSHFALPRLGWGSLELYVVQPLLWLALAAGVLWRARRALPRPGWLLISGLLLGALQVAVAALLGLVFGFGQTFSARAWTLVALNLWYAGTQLVGFECARWAFVCGLRRRPGLALLAAWPLFALLALAPSQFSQLRSLGTGMSFVGSALLPALAGSLLATYLAQLGGPLPALLYRGLPIGVEWVLPVLPRLSWLAAAFAGTILPLLGLMLVHDRYLPGGPPELAAGPQPASKTERGGSLGAWVLVALTAVGLLWFNTGLFGYRPSLVSGYSMQPTFVLGDLVVSRTVPLETLQVGDIVRYQLGSVDVVHRIKAIQVAADGQLTFLTRGDNNNTDDPLVSAQQVRGKVVLILPKVGWPAVGLRLLVSGVLAAAGGGAP